MFNERRKFPRSAISEVILFRKMCDGWSAGFSEGRALNISLGGIYFLTDEALQQGEMLELTFRRLRSPSDARGVVKVVRVERTLDGYGIGAEFVPMPVGTNEPAAGQGALR